MKFYRADRIVAVLTKPIFALSLFFWCWLLASFGFQLVFGEPGGSDATGKMENLWFLVLVVILSLAFIKLSWEGLLYWPGRRPRLRAKSD